MNFTRREAFLDINQGELDHLFENGDFSENIRNHSGKVVVLMSQDWCPQWAAMKAFLGDFTGKASIFVILYNRHRQFGRILDFKENRFHNDEIPYLRYYSGGHLVAESAYLRRDAFAAMLERGEK